MLHRHRAFPVHEIRRTYHLEVVHPFLLDHTRSREEDRVPSSPHDSSFLEKPLVFWGAFARKANLLVHKAADAFGGVEEGVHHAIHRVVEDDCPIGDHPTGAPHSILLVGRRTVAVAWTLVRLVSLAFRWASWDVLLSAEVVGLFRRNWAEVVVGGEDMDFDVHPIVLLVLASWEVLRVGDTCQEGGLDQGVVHNRGEVDARHTDLAIPCVHRALHILAAGTVVVAACGHGLAAFHQEASHRLCAACCLVVELRSPP